MIYNPVKHGSPCRNAFEKWLTEVKDLAFAERGAWEAWEAAWTEASTKREMGADISYWRDRALAAEKLVKENIPSYCFRHPTQIEDQNP